MADLRDEPEVPADAVLFTIQPSEQQRHQAPVPVTHGAYMNSGILKTAVQIEDLETGEDVIVQEGSIPLVALLGDDVEAFTLWQAETSRTSQLGAQAAVITPEELGVWRRIVNVRLAEALCVHMHSCPHKHMPENVAAG